MSKECNKYLNKERKICFGHVTIAVVLMRAIRTAYKIFVRIRLVIREEETKFHSYLLSLLLTHFSFK
jgi:hypothetical protein